MHLNMVAQGLAVTRHSPFTLFLFRPEKERLPIKVRKETWYLPRWKMDRNFLKRTLVKGP